MRVRETSYVVFKGIFQKCYYETANKKEKEEMTKIKKYFLKVKMRSPIREREIAQKIDQKKNQEEIASPSPFGYPI